MTVHTGFDRRAFLEGLAAVGVGTLASSAVAAAETTLAQPTNNSCSAPPTPLTEMRPNMTGAYDPWLADTVLGTKPGTLSFRTDRFANVADWQTAARKRTWQCIAPVNLGEIPQVRVDQKREATIDAIQECDGALLILTPDYSVLPGWNPCLETGCTVTTKSKKLSSVKESLALTWRTWLGYTQATSKAANHGCVEHTHPLEGFFSNANDSVPSGL